MSFPSDDLAERALARNGSRAFLRAPTCNRFFVPHPHHTAGQTIQTGRSIHLAGFGGHEQPITAPAAGMVRRSRLLSPAAAGSEGRPNFLVTRRAAGSS